MSPSKGFRLSFAESVSEIVRSVQATLANGDENFDRLNTFEDAAYLKDASGTLTFVNQAYLDVFATDVAPLGHSGADFLTRSVKHTSLHTDALVLSGTTYVECEHVGHHADGSAYVMQTHKRNVRSFGHEKYVILGVTRSVRSFEHGTVADAQRFDIKQVHDAFRTLEERDQEICRLSALGLSSQEIAARFDMTSRNIEIRRKKALTVLGVAKPIDLARILVRLKERGYLDLDI